MAGRLPDRSESTRNSRRQGRAHAPLKKRTVRGTFPTALQFPRNEAARRGGFLPRPGPLSCTPKGRRGLVTCEATAAGGARVGWSGHSDKSRASTTLLSVLEGTLKRQRLGASQRRNFGWN